MTKRYQTPELEIDDLDEEDIVCASLNENQGGYPGENGGQL